MRIALDDLIESALRSPMVLLRARDLLAGLLNGAPAMRGASISRRLQRVDELGAGGFPRIWRDAGYG